MDQHIQDLLFNVEEDPIDHLIDELLETDSEEETDRRRERTTVHRDREGAERKLDREYFSGDCIYDDEHFRRRFRISKQIFGRIHDSIDNRQQAFTQKPDCTGRYGFSTRMKMAIALRILAQGIATDSVDDMYAAGESTANKFMYDFCDVLISEFSHFLSPPSAVQTKIVLQRHATKGFRGMLGSKHGTRHAGLYRAAQHGC